MNGARLVHVVDAAAAVRKSISFLVGAAGFKAVDWPSGDAFLGGVDVGEPCCVLLDVHMPPPDGMAVQRELSRRAPALPVIVFTSHDDPAIHVDAFRAGAVDVIEKPFKRATLLAAIDDAFRRLEDPVAADVQRRAATRKLAPLNKDERLVLESLAAGWSNDRIAQELGITLHIVELRRAGLLEKLGVPSLSGAVRLLFMAMQETPWHK